MYLKDQSGNVWVAQSEVVQEWLMTEKSMVQVPYTEVDRNNVVTDPFDLMGALGLHSGIESDPVYRANEYSEKLYIQASLERIREKYGSENIELLIRGVERYYKILHMSKAEVWHTTEKILDNLSQNSTDNVYIKAFLFDHIISLV